MSPGGSVRKGYMNRFTILVDYVVDVFFPLHELQIGTICKPLCVLEPRFVFRVPVLETSAALETNDSVSVTFEAIFH
jgi:hypothetical protein